MTLELYARDTLIGYLTPSKRAFDWPRFFYDFEPTEQYETVRDLIDLKGMGEATREQLEAGDRLRLRTVTEEGEESHWRFIFLDVSRGTAVLRQGNLRPRPDQSGPPGADPLE